MRTNNQSTSGDQSRDNQPGTVVPKRTIPPQIIIDLVRFADGLAVFLAGALAHIVYFAFFSAGSWQLTLSGSAIGAIVSMLVFQQIDLYGTRSTQNWGETIAKTCLAWLAIFATLVAFAFLLKVAGSYSRGWALSWFILTTILLAFGRALGAFALRYSDAGAVMARRIIIIGDGARADALVEKLSRQGSLCQVLKVFPNPIHSQVGEPQDSSREIHMEDIYDLVRAKNVNDVILAVPRTEEKTIWTLTERLAHLPVAVSLSPDLFLLHNSYLKTDQFGDVTTTTLLSPPFRNWDSVIKGIEDRLIGGLLLLFVLPLFACIALAIKLDSKGPVFFVQRRHGFNNRVIPVIKFRTMTTLDDGDHVLQASKNDARITRVGRFLRKTSLDELPQLLNVVRGEMSMVGPRPHAIAHNDKYDPIIRSYSKRHIVKPGITGWAQINGYRGEITDISLMERRVEHDLFYIENWSLWLDIKILLLTPLHGFVHPNAY